MGSGGRGVKNRNLQGKEERNRRIIWEKLITRANNVRKTTSVGN
jgi:hypothetical protein